MFWVTFYLMEALLYCMTSGSFACPPKGPCIHSVSQGPVVFELIERFMAVICTSSSRWSTPSEHFLIFSRSVGNSEVSVGLCPGGSPWGEGAGGGLWDPENCPRFRLCERALRILLLAPEKQDVNGGAGVSVSWCQQASVHKFCSYFGNRGGLWEVDSVSRSRLR